MTWEKRILKIIGRERMCFSFLCTLGNALTTHLQGKSYHWDETTFLMRKERMLLHLMWNTVICEYPHQPCSKSICRQFRQRKQKYLPCGPWICTEQTPASPLSYWSTFDYFLKEAFRLLKTVQLSKEIIYRSETTLDLAAEK